jgi:ABC-2 type transport system ATP-binding protein
MTTTTSGTGTAPAIRVTGLGLEYRRRFRPAGRAVRDCAFELPPGRVAALVGANGSGKTSLLSVLAGVRRPTEGEVRIDGRPVPDPGADGPGRTAFVAHDTPLPRRFTVTELLEAGRRTRRRWDGPRAAAWLDRFGIPGDRWCGELSTGQQTQVALAFALGSAPSVLLLDEPLARIDPVGRVDMVRALLAEVADTGLTVLLSTHGVAELTGLADRLLLLARGRLVLDDDLDDVLDRHVRYVGPRADTPPGPGAVVLRTHTDRQSTFLVRLPDGVDRPAVAEPWRRESPTREEIVVARLRADPEVTT